MGVDTGNCLFCGTNDMAFLAQRNTFRCGTCGYERTPLDLLEDMSLCPDSLVERLPRPLAYTYQRLKDEVSEKKPKSAALAMRGAWECGVRFVACLGLADLYRAGISGERWTELLARLFKWSGLSLGDWAMLLGMTCDPGLCAADRRFLPELTTFYRRGRSLTDVGRAISGEDNLVMWRNKVFGHGVSDQSDDWYAFQLMHWIPPLNNFLGELSEVLTAWSLRETEDGPVLHGPGDAEEDAAHGQDSRKEPEPVYLVSERGEVLEFGPLLSVQHCPVCSERHLFFYDKSTRKKRKTLKTELLDFVSGHFRLCVNWAPALVWANTAPEHIWQRSSFEQQAVEEDVNVLFRSYEANYTRPDWIMERVWQELDSLLNNRGYVHLEGPGGVGKSYLVHAIQREGRDRFGIPVLCYHIAPGVRSDYRTFITLLNDEAREHLAWRTQEIQTKGLDVIELRKEFRKFLSTLMCRQTAWRFVLAIDGLDQLPKRSPEGHSIVDFLIPPRELPEHCALLLTSRPELQEGVAKALDQLRAESAEGQFRSLSLDPDAPANISLLQSYALNHLPGPMRREELAAHVVSRAKGVFLYVFHLVQALESGAFAADEDLPEAHEFYSAYLKRLCARVGDERYEPLYRKLLLFLVAARAPVTLEQLEAWTSQTRLRHTLCDISDFVQELRYRSWHERVHDADDRPRYQIAHQDFISFVEHDPILGRQLQETHAYIARAIESRHAGKWDTIDSTSEEDIYDACYIFEHESRATPPPLPVVRARIKALILLARILYKKRRYIIAKRILQSCLTAIDSRGGNGEWPDSTLDQAHALSCLSSVLAKLGRLYEAEAHQRENVDICRRLIETRRGIELQIDLIRGLNSLGNVLLALGRLEKAETCHRENEALCRWLVEKKQCGDVRKLLARALNNRGNVLMKLGRLREAETCLQENVAILHQLVENEQRKEFRDYLARALNNLGGVYSNSGLLKKSETCRRRSVNILNQLVKTEQRQDLRDHLAGALNNLGKTLSALGRMREAEECQRKNVHILRQLVNNEKRRELRNDLALALNNLGRVFYILEHYVKAEACQRENVEILRLLVEKENRHELRNDLARGYKNLGKVLSVLGQYEEAATCQRKNVQLRRQLVEKEKRLELRSKLARSLNNLGKVLADLGQYQEAEACQRENVDILSRLVEQEQRLDLRDCLAGALGSLGEVLFTQGRRKEAKACHLKSVKILDQLVENEERGELRCLLACALSKLGTAFSSFGALAEAEACHRKSADILRRLVRTYGHGALLPALAMVLGTLGKIYHELSQLEKAKEFLLESMQYFSLMSGDNSSAASQNEFICTNEGMKFSLHRQTPDAEAGSYLPQLVQIYKTVLQDEQFSGLTEQFAFANMVLGNIFAAQTRLNDACSCFHDSAVAYRRLFKENPREELLEKLAVASSALADTLRQRGREQEAAACLRELEELRGRIRFFAD